MNSAQENRRCTMAETVDQTASMSIATRSPMIASPETNLRLAVPAWSANSWTAVWSCPPCTDGSLGSYQARVVGVSFARPMRGPDSHTPHNAECHTCRQDDVRYAVHCDRPARGAVNPRDTHASPN